MTGAAPLRVLTVCTHNRTRSVMMEALLRPLLSARLGPDGVLVASAGYGPAGLPAIPDAVDAMRRRGLDVADHRSRTLDRSMLDWADVVLTAERDHVVRISGLDPTALRRAMTLPEFITAVANADRSSARDVRERVTALTASRSAMAYLSDPIEEIADPTGWSPRAFESAVVTLETTCRAAATALVGL